MKRAYSTPKAAVIDFSYDEQVVATSGESNEALYGDPQKTGYCQQSSPVSCVYFWEANSEMCKSAPMSLRPTV